MALSVIIMADNDALIIGSTILKINLDLEKKLQNKISIVVIDNASADETWSIAQKAGATVFRYSRKQTKSVLMKKGIEYCIKNGRKINLFLDLEGGNDANDVISLADAALEKGEKFAIGFLLPAKKTDALGCIALDPNMLMQLSKKGEYIHDFIYDLFRSNKFEITNIQQEIAKPTKMKFKIKSRGRKMREIFINLRRQHPLKFYGGLGVAVFTTGLASGFYTVDYFYKNQNLYYPTAFLSASLILISGFLMVEGLMLNALTVLVERIKAARRWQEAIMRLK